MNNRFVPHAVCKIEPWRPARKRFAWLLPAVVLSGCATTESPILQGELGTYPVDRTRYRSEAKNARVRFLVLHYTALDFAKSVETLTQGRVSADYLVPDPQDPSYQAARFKQLRVFSLVDEHERAWHAGISAWEDRTNLNDTSIGIEIVNLASDIDGQFSFPEFSVEQIDAVAALAADVLARYPDITPTRVVAHSDIAYTRKSDPGPRFPWYELHQRGIGPWYEQATMEQYLAMFDASGLPSQPELLDAFALFGYAAPPENDAEAYRMLVRAFQMRFRPSSHDGDMDMETAAILYALNERYRW